MNDPPRFDRRSLLAAALGLAASAPRGLHARALPAHPPPPDELVRLAGRCVLAGFHGRAGIPPILRARVARDALAGVLLTAGNFQTMAELTALTATVQRSLPPGAFPVLVGADQEGGRVSHLSPPLPVFPSMTALGMADDEDLTRRVGASLAASMRSAGCNFDLAPVLDVRTSSDNLVDLGRVFGRTPDLVARHGVAFAQGLCTAGLLGCAKHFPGHGGTPDDSHVRLPQLAFDRHRLEALDLVPFRAAAPWVPAMMLAHVVYAGVDPELPASLSPAIAQGLLRDTLGYDGVAVSDDLEMAPIRQRWGVPRAATMAMSAGCDLLLVAHTPTEALAAIDALACAADANGQFHQRLVAAAARVDGLRRVLAGLRPNRAPAEDPASLVREVFHRTHGLRLPSGVDPTLRR